MRKTQEKGFIIRERTQRLDAREQAIAELRKRWNEAAAIDSEDVDPVPVFARLERKYGASQPRRSSR